MQTHNRKRESIVLICVKFQINRLPSVVLGQLIVDFLMMMLEVVEVVLVVVGYWLVVSMHRLLVAQLLVLVYLKSPSILFQLPRK
jgi:hypothetical protein